MFEVQSGMISVGFHDVDIWCLYEVISSVVCWPLSVDVVVGLPKAAVITHLQSLKAAGGFWAYGGTEDDVIYTPLPLYHSAASLVGIGGTIELGTSYIWTHFSLNDSKYTTAQIIYCTAREAACPPGAYYIYIYSFGRFRKIERKRNDYHFYFWLHCQLY